MDHRTAFSHAADSVKPLVYVETLPDCCCQHCCLILHSHCHCAVVPLHASDKQQQLLPLSLAHMSSMNCRPFSLKDQLTASCLLQWQFCPDNTGVAKRRRVKKAAAQAVAAAAAPGEPASEAHKAILPRATDLPAHGQVPEMAQCRIQPSLSGQLPTAESAGASLGVSDAGKGSTTDMGPDESSAVQPARQDEALVNDPQQLPPQLLSQLPLRLASPIPGTQPAALTVTQPAHASDRIGTCGHPNEAPPKRNPDALHLPAQLHFIHEEDSLHTVRQSATQEPTDTSPDQGVQPGAEDGPERTPADLVGTLGEQAPHGSACQATAASIAAQEAAPPPANQAHHERAVREWSPEPRAATEGPRAVMGPEHVAQALHDAFAMYAKSRSRSQDSQQRQQRQQRPWQLSVPNPFRVSPEALQRPALPLTQLPAAAQESTQTPAQNCPARATSRSMSPEALHVLQLGIADQQSPTVHNNRCNKSASRSKSPEVLLLAASMPCGETLLELTATTSP